MRPRLRLGVSTRKARFSRRAAMGSLGGGVLGIAARGVTARESMNLAATPATGSGATPAGWASAGLSGLAFQDSEFDGQFLLALDTIPYRGADIGDCFITARSIPDGDRATWYEQWFALGDRVFGLAEESRKAGHDVSARDAYLRALTYYRTSGAFLFKPPVDPRLVTGFDRQKAAFEQAGALLPHPAEAVQIPYEATTLPGYLLLPERGSAPYPTLVMTDGYDGTVQELYLAGAAAALERGYAALIFDGPGQGEALLKQKLHFRPDWENVVTPVIDYALTRPEIDPKRIALMGRSWGGYLAPRAATAEHRIAAIIADAAQYDPAGHFGALLPPELRDHLDTVDPAMANAAIEQFASQSPQMAYAFNRGMLTHGVATPFDYIKTIVLGGYTIKGIADHITCPTLVCEGEQDVRGGDAKPLYDAITAPKKYVLFKTADGAGEHDEAGAATRFSQVVFDWLDEVMAQVS